MSDLCTAIHEIEQQLMTRAAKAETPYWRKGSDEYYCLNCVKEAAWKRYKQGSRNEGCAIHCEGCGKALEYTLNDAGVEAELEFHEDIGFFWTMPKECYQMVRLAAALSTDTQRKRFLQIVAESAYQPSEFER